MILRLFSLFIIFFPFCISAIAVEVCFFDTGQGNCIAVKHVDRLVFIDCGGGAPINTCRQAFAELTSLEHGKLAELAKNINKCHFLITHDHKDHKNLYDVMRSVIEDESDTIEFVDYLLPRKISGSREVAEFVTQITSIFRDDVELIPIRPDVWTNNRAQNPEHDYNVMFKLKAANRNILFMGECKSTIIYKNVW